MLPFHLIVLHLSLSCLYCVLLLFCILFLCFDPHTPSPSALIPFLLFSLLPCPSSPLSLLILFISADFTNHKVEEEFPFYLFVRPKGLSKSSAVLSPPQSFGVYCAGCLLLYSHIKGLPNSTNQIILYKQKDLLQLVIDSSYPLCSVDCYDC